jgi:hypothetical protein
VRRIRGAAPLPPVLAVFALAAVAPLLVSPGGDVLNNMVLAAVYVVMALGLNIIVGFAGLLDLGYVAFFAIGAYTAAYFGSGFWADAGSDGRGIAVLVGDSVAGTPGIHVNFVLILALAVAATAVAGTLIGVPTLRLRGDYIAIVTLALEQRPSPLDAAWSNAYAGARSAPIRPCSVPVRSPAGSSRPCWSRLSSCAGSEMATVSADSKRSSWSALVPGTTEPLDEASRSARPPCGGSAERAQGSTDRTGVRGFLEAGRSDDVVDRLREAARSARLLREALCQATYLTAPIQVAQHGPALSPLRVPCRLRYQARYFASSSASCSVRSSLERARASMPPPTLARGLVLLSTT